MEGPSGRRSRSSLLSWGIEAKKAPRGAAAAVTSLIPNRGTAAEQPWLFSRPFLPFRGEGHRSSPLPPSPYLSAHRLHQRCPGDSTQGFSVLVDASSEDLHRLVTWALLRPSRLGVHLSEEALHDDFAKGVAISCFIPRVMGGRREGDKLLRSAVFDFPSPCRGPGAPRGLSGRRGAVPSSPCKRSQGDSQ